MQLETDLMRFVKQRGDKHAEVTPLTDLLESGLLDSLLLMDLIFHIEDSFNVRFDGSHIDPANFRTISAIVRLVRDQTLMPRRELG
jgi:acyl carrier protein